MAELTPDVYVSNEVFDEILSPKKQYEEVIKGTKVDVVSLMNDLNFKCGYGEDGQIVFYGEKKKEKNEVKAEVIKDLQKLQVVKKAEQKEKTMNRIRRNISKMIDLTLIGLDKLNQVINPFAVTEAQALDLSGYKNKLNKEKEQKLKEIKQTIEADKQTIEASKRRQKELDKAIDQNHKAIDQNHKAIDQMKTHIKQMQFLGKNINNSSMKNELLEAIRIARETNYGEEGNKKSMNNYREANKLLDKYEKIVNNY